MVDFIRWANASKTALYIQAPHSIADEDIPAILYEINTMSQSVDFPIDLIVDRRKTTNVPRKTLISMQKVISKNRYQRVVFIGFSMLPKMLVETLTRFPYVFSSEPIFVDTLDQAYQQLGIDDAIATDSDTQTTY